MVLQASLDMVKQYLNTSNGEVPWQVLHHMVSKALDHVLPLIDARACFTDLLVTDAAACCVLVSLWALVCRWQRSRMEGASKVAQWT